MIDDQTGRKPLQNSLLRFRDPGANIPYVPEAVRLFQLAIGKTTLDRPLSPFASKSKPSGIALNGQKGDHPLKPMV